MESGRLRTLGRGPFSPPLSRGSPRRRGGRLRPAAVLFGRSRRLQGLHQHHPGRRLATTRGLAAIPVRGRSGETLPVLEPLRVPGDALPWEWADGAAAPVFVAV